MLKLAEIKPPPYRRPSEMLRNLADDIDKGKFPEFATLAIVAMTDEGALFFGGGRDTDNANIAYAFGVAHNWFINANKIA